jgi:hypothetical protein
VLFSTILAAMACTFMVISISLGILISLATSLPFHVSNIPLEMRY